MSAPRAERAALEDAEGQLLGAAGGDLGHRGYGDYDEHGALAVTTPGDMTMVT